jgi:hypothetical protein
MNSITRPRRRCRVKSVNFKVFDWLLVREAYLRICHDAPTPEDRRQAARNANPPDTTSVRRVAERFLFTYPERRFLP